MANLTLGQFSGSDATDALRKTIEDLATKTAKQTRQMLWLTWAMAVMALASLAATGVQLWLEWNKHT